MRTLPPSESLQAMLAAAELGSLTAAAEELGVTHGALSRRIQGLESWLGQPIFERHGRGGHLDPRRGDVRAQGGEIARCDFDSGDGPEV